MKAQLHLFAGEADYNGQVYDTDRYVVLNDEGFDMCGEHMTLEEAEDYIENKDLFEFVESLPEEVQDVLEPYLNDSNTYESCAELVAKLKPLGYTCDYGLDGQPFDLKKI